MARKNKIQIDLFGEPVRTLQKPEPGPREAGFMRDLMKAARALGLPCLHVQHHCGARYYVRCSHCGHAELVVCHGRNNIDNVNLPDICGIGWAIETKRTRNQAGNPFEPAPGQAAAFDRLRAAGVPVLVASPGSEPEAIQFLNRMARIKDNAEI